MKKRDEFNDVSSCLNKAYPDEIIFVLLARDPSASATIRYWVYNRIRRGLNNRDDEQIKNALKTAELMDEQRLNTVPE